MRLPPFRTFAVIAAAFAAAVMPMACGSSASTYTAPSTTARCAVTTTVTPSTLPAGGGTASIAVDTERECQWTASADGAWLKVMTGASGQGPGTISVAAVANADPAARTAAVLVNDQRVELSQAAAACDISLGQSSASVPPSGGSGHVDVRASSSLCDWTASSSVDWMAITAGATGKGSGSVAFNVSPTAGLARSGSLTIAGLSFTVNQSDGCSYSISPTASSAGSSGGSTPVTVSTGQNCPWTATSNASWIAVAPSSGSGNGLVTVTVAATSAAGRTGTATIASQTFTITQSEGCTIALGPTSAAVGAAGGTARFDVSTAAGCPWSAVSQASWIGISSGASGSGSGAVQLAVSANPGADRSGVVTVGAQVFTVSQTAGASCTYALSPTSAAVAAAGGASRFDVTAGAGCSWSAVSQASWIAISSGANGSGSGTVQLAVSANPGADRSGIVTAGAQVFTVNQAGGCTYSLSPASQTIPAAGASSAFTVNAGGGCSWSAAVSAGWITVSPPSTGTGTGTVQFSVAANSGDTRNGTITVAGQTFAINQNSGCTYVLMPPKQDIPSDGGKGSVSVKTTSGCTWSATSMASWITVTGASSGTGSGMVKFDVDNNPKGGGTRTGTIAIADQVFTINQHENR